MSDDATPKPNPPRPEAALSEMRTVASEDLFQGRRELLIQHRGQIYRLLQTRTGKLILQK